MLDGKRQLFDVSQGFVWIEEYLEKYNGIQQNLSGLEGLVGTERAI